MKKIKKIMSKMPTDPFEAELLALAGGLVGKKDGEEQFSDDSDYMATDDEEDEANDGRGQVSQSGRFIYSTGWSDFLTTAVDATL